MERKNNMKIICPYVYDSEISNHKAMFWEYDVYYEKDMSGIGSDLMYQKMWNKFPNDDIFILHADIYIHHINWYEKLQEYIEVYPNAGMIGCLLLYPAKDKNGNSYIQHAGGKFDDNNNPDHYGSGISMESGQLFKEPEADVGQYDSVRKVAWTTFGGLYIKREVLQAVGDFAPEYEWTYNRDVDYCLQTRKLGYDIYNVPIKMLHHESKDNKRIKTKEKAAMEMRNLKTLKEKWEKTEWYKTL